MHQWLRLGYLNESNVDFSKYNQNIGIYKAILNNEIVYIGKATEVNNYGFRKRLRDYTRKSDSARNFPAGKKMYKNKDNIIIEILIVDSSNDGVKKADELEKAFISEFKPKWNPPILW